MRAIHLLWYYSPLSADRASSLKPNNKQKRNAEDGMDVDQPVPAKPPPAVSEAQSDIEHITHLASTLMSLGDSDVYSKTYEELVRAVRRSGKVDDKWEPPSADVSYEYKWDVPEAEDGQVFGPFSEDELHSWYRAQYFGVAGEKIKVRRRGGEWGSWDDVVV